MKDKNNPQKNRRIMTKIMMLLTGLMFLIFVVRFSTIMLTKKVDGVFLCKNPVHIGKGQGSTLDSPGVKALYHNQRFLSLAEGDVGKGYTADGNGGFFGIVHQKDLPPN